LQARPQDATSRQYLRNHYANLALSWQELGRHAELARAATELPGVSPQGWKENPRAAAHLSRCAALAAQDTELEEPRRAEVAQAYADQAMQLLREAVRQGYKDVKHLKTNSDFKPLAARADFQELVSQLEKQPGVIR
jgi:hypothetical protein